jgi:flagellar hook-basal body complex protein FliE
MATPGIAANIYAQIARAGNPLSAGDRAGASDASSLGFGSMLKDALSTVVQAGMKSDGQAQALAAGKANVLDVVTAVAETEVAIEALVSVRDKVIQSYEEIMRMPI